MPCSRCGAEISPDSLLCERCGAVVQGRQEGASPVPSSPEGLPSPVSGTGEEAQSPPTLPSAGGGRGPDTVRSAGPSAASSAASRASSHPACRRVPWIPVTIAAAVLILAAGFFWPGWFRGERKELSGPEQVVDSYFQAMARRDGAAMLSLFLPGDLEEVMRMRGIKDLATLEEEASANLNESFPRGDLRLSGLKYESTEEEDEAVVRVTAGKATYTDEWGEKVTETPESGGSVFGLGLREFRLKLEDGRWYILMRT